MGASADDEILEGEDAAALLGGVEGVDEDELKKLEEQLASGGDEADANGEGDDLDGGGEEVGEEVLGEVSDGEAEAAADEDEFSDDIDVEDHLKDAVEGSLRLKRLLSRDEDAPDAKKLKLDSAAAGHKAKVQQTLMRWGLASDSIVKYVLESCTMQELEDLAKSGYVPDKSWQFKSPGEILARHCSDVRERKLPSGGKVDTVGAFKFRWKLGFDKEKVLRALSHKDLRHVISTFDGTQDIDNVIKEAEEKETEKDNTTESAIPEAPGVAAIGRFLRLELIDPLADAAVFGDANLTFAIKLAAHRKALGHVGRVIATTFEEIDTLRERYKEIDDSIATLEEHFAEVYHGVDCTRIALDERFKDMQGKFGAVYYNFPHSGAIQGFFDGHPVVNWRHENLMRLFFRALRSFMKPGGYVKVASNMGAVGVRYSYIVGSALENEFLHVETVPFLEWHLHRYGRSYGDKRDIYKRPDAKNNQSYNAQAAERDMVYCFSFAPTGQQIGKQMTRLPPTLKTLKGCQDGPFKSVQGVGRDTLAKQLHSRFVTEVSGTHVG